MDEEKIFNYALSLSEDGRILSATYPQYANADAVLVEELPEGGITEYQYIDGEYIYNPLPVEEVVEEPTEMEILRADVDYLLMLEE